MRLCGQAALEDSRIPLSNRCRLAIACIMMRLGGNARQTAVLSGANRRPASPTTTGC